MKHYTMIIAGLVLVGLAQLGLAQPANEGQPPPGSPVQRPERPGPSNELRPRLGLPDPLLRVLDENQDGELSETEIANASAALRKLDRNQDGKLTREELRPQPPERPGERRPPSATVVERIMSEDKNGDGKVSREELPERMQRNFERLDANGDGFIDRTEAEAMADRIRPNAVPGNGPPPRRPPGGL